MHSLAAIGRKVTMRVREEGVALAARYYIRWCRQFAHRLLYDRWQDRFEVWRTGEARVVRDIVGPVGSRYDMFYEPYPRLPLLWSLAALRIDPADYTFVDFGSGRGRALLTAARLPFRRCVGVEFSRSLHAEACENIANYPSQRLACREVTSVHQNAVAFELPAGNVVAFFFNPFMGNVLTRVTERIEESCRTTPRKMKIIFVNRNRTPLFPGRPSFRPIEPPRIERLKLALFGTIPVDFFEVEPVDRPSTAT